MDKGSGIELPSVVMGRKGLKILLGNNAKNVITQSVVWEKPNLNHESVTQLGITITVILIDVPLILVKDKSNAREDSWVTLGGLRCKVESDRRMTL
jgi:hypothetical protein